MQTSNTASEPTATSSSGGSFVGCDRKQKRSESKLVVGLDSDIRQTYFVKNLLRREVDRLVPVVCVLVQLDRLLPIVKGAGNVHLLGVVRPARAGSECQRLCYYVLVYLRNLGLRSRQQFSFGATNHVNV